MNEEELPEEDNAVSSDFLAPVKEDASTISVSTFQPSNELIDSQDKMRENCSLSISRLFRTVAVLLQQHSGSGNYKNFTSL
jgi:hypothetical protein